MAGIFDTGIFDHATPLGIFDHLAATPTPDPSPGSSTGGWEWLNSLNPPSERPEPEPTEKPRKKRRVLREGQQIVLAPDPVIETGIIDVQPAWDVLVDLQRRAEEAEIERRKRLWAIALADDEWLMMA